MLARPPQRQFRPALLAIPGAIFRENAMRDTERPTAATRVPRGPPRERARNAAASGGVPWSSSSMAEDGALHDGHTSIWISRWIGSIRPVTNRCNSG